MKFLTKAVIKGLAVLLPVALSIWFVYWLGSSAESLLRPAIVEAMEWLDLRYYPGLGVVVGVLAVVLIGLLTHLLLFRTLVEWLGRLMTKIPLVKTVYGGIRDLMDFVSRSQDGGSMNQVVSVRFGEQMRLIGIVTRDDFADVPGPLLPAEDTVAVYLPMSYQIGGFTLFVPRDRVEPIDMGVEEAMRFALTAGMSTEKPSPVPGKK